MDTAATPPIAVAVCIATYLRPLGLARCLESLAGLQFRRNPGVQPRIIVVDNDGAESARTVVEQAARQLAWPVRYAVEPQRGAPYALNRAVALAADCEYLALVDDDETVAPGWLDELLAAQQRFTADVVTGPVLPVFAPGLPAWLTGGRFYTEVARRATGTPLDFARSGNALIWRDVLGRIPIEGPFDPRFGLIGGYDTIFFKRLFRSGARIIWCDEAVVREIVPESRANVRWVVQRAYREGNTRALVERAMPAPLRRHLAALYREASLITLTGVTKLLPSLFLGRAKILRQVRMIARGAGMGAGLLGHRYEEYRAIHGS